MRTLKVSALLLAAWLAVFSVAVSAKALPRDDAAIAQQFVRVLKLVNERQLPIEMDFATTWVGVQGDYHSHEMAYYFVVEDYASEVYWEALESADEGEALRDMLMEQICTETKQTATDMLAYFNIQKITFNYRDEQGRHLFTMRPDCLLRES